MAPVTRRQSSIDWGSYVDLEQASGDVTPARKSIAGRRKSSIARDLPPTPITPTASIHSMGLRISKRRSSVVPDANEEVWDVYRESSSLGAAPATPFTPFSAQVARYTSAGSDDVAIFKFPPTPASAPAFPDSPLRSRTTALSSLAEVVEEPEEDFAPVLARRQRQKTAHIDSPVNSPSPNDGDDDDYVPDAAELRKADGANDVVKLSKTGTGGRRTKAEKAGRIPRPPNSFIIYRSDQLQRLKKNPKTARKTQAEISRLIGQMWQQESRETKAWYDRESELRKLAHHEQYPGYVYIQTKRKAPALDDDFQNSPRPARRRRTKTVKDSPLPQMKRQRSVTAPAALETEDDIFVLPGISTPFFPQQQTDVVFAHDRPTVSSPMSRTPSRHAQIFRNATSATQYSMFTPRELPAQPNFGLGLSIPVIQPDLEPIRTAQVAVQQANPFAYSISPSMTTGDGSESRPSTAPGLETPDTNASIAHYSPMPSRLPLPRPSLYDVLKPSSPLEAHFQRHSVDRHFDDSNMMLTWLHASIEHDLV